MYPSAVVFHYSARIFSDKTVLGAGATHLDVHRDVGPQDVMLVYTCRPYAKKLCAVRALLMTAGCFSPGYSTVCRAMLDNALSVVSHGTTFMKVRCLLALAMLLPAFAAAQSFPSRPLRMIIPFPAGGGSDAVGRIVAPKLGERLGQQIVVDNRAGAGGSIGTEAAVRATPDGYNMVLASTSEIAINPALYKLGYDTVKDLTPVAMIASAAMVVVVAPNAPVGSVKDLIALAKSKPGTINVASAGNGTITHLSGELFRSMAGLDWAHVPYKGAAPALTDLAGGRVQVMFSSLPAAMPLIKSGRVKAVALSTKARVGALPDVPTVMESGLPGYDVEYWWGLFVPAATPQTIVKRLAEELAQTLRQKDVIASLANQGAVPGETTQPQFAQFVQSEYAKWTKVAKSSGAKAD